MQLNRRDLTKGRPEAGLLYSASNDALFFSQKDKEELGRMLNLRKSILDAGEILSGKCSDLEILISGWGTPPITPALLDALPALRVVFHVGGSVRSLVGSGDLFNKGVRLSSTNPELAQSVAEFCFAQIIFAVRRVHDNMRLVRKLRTYPAIRQSADKFPLVVGLIGYGTIARALRKLLRQVPIQVLAYDPYITSEQSSMEDINLVDLMELFKASDIVSCHLPHIPATEAILQGAHFSVMKKQAVFLNTARGQVVNEAELVEVLNRRPDLWAMLDVVADEPISENHPFHDMKNVMLTPHIAGCTGLECHRLGRFAKEEINRWLNDSPLSGEVLQENLPIKA
jgi:phosphoglycerate dehydrogenase-like enzyme